jgi:hypothetical protein
LQIQVSVMSFFGKYNKYIRARSCFLREVQGEHACFEKVCKNVRMLLLVPICRGLDARVRSLSSGCVVCRVSTRWLCSGTKQVRRV